MGIQDQRFCEARLAFWAGSPSPSSPIKEGINNFNYRSRILQIGPRPCDPIDPRQRDPGEHKALEKKALSSYSTKPLE
jgi:hypothetical protein